MKTAPLSIIILDQHLALGGALGETLDRRFGKRIRLSNFSDADSCIGKLAPDSQVFILDYASDANDPANTRRWKLFNAIRWADPQSMITLLRSTGNITVAKEKMLKQISTFIVKKENHLYALLNHLDESPYQPELDTETYSAPGKQSRYHIRGFPLFLLRVFLAIGIITGIVLLGVKLFY